MKLLLDPVFTNRSIKRCATWYAMKLISQTLMEEFDDLYVYAPTPPEDHKRWELDDLFDSDRVTHIPMAQAKDRYKEYYFLKRPWIDNFAFWGKYWDWDICITPRSVAIPQMRFCSTKALRKHIICFDPLPLVKYKRTVTAFDMGNENLMMQTFSGYANADLVVINTMHEIQGVMENARRFLSAWSLRELDHKMACKYSAPGGVALNFPHANKKPRSAGQPLNVLYTQRLDSTERRPDKVFEAFRYAFITQGEKKFNFGVTTNSSVSEGEFQQFMQLKTPDREQYYQELANCHVCATWALEEGLPLGLFEAAAFGVICIAKREKWSLDFYGPDYPFMVKSVPEAVAQIRWIEMDYDDAYRTYLEWYDQWFLPQWESKGNFNQTMINYVEAAYATYGSKVEKRGMHKQKLAHIVNEHFDKPETQAFNLIEAILELEELKKVRNRFSQELKTDHFDVPMQRGMAMYETRWELMHYFGWQDGAGPGDLKRA